MQSDEERKDLDVNWSKIWDEERQNLIEELKESLLLTNQIGALEASSLMYETPKIG